MASKHLLVDPLYFWNFPLQNSWFDRTIGWQMGEGGNHLQAFHEIPGTCLGKSTDIFQILRICIHVNSLALAQSLFTKSGHKKGLVSWDVTCTHEIPWDMPDISSSFKASPPIALPGRCRGASMRVPKKRGPWSCKTSRGTPRLMRCIQVSCFLLWRPLCSPGLRVVKNENQKRRRVKLRHIFS